MKSRCLSIICARTCLARRARIVVCILDDLPAKTFRISYCLKSHGSNIQYTRYVIYVYIIY